MQNVSISKGNSKMGRIASSLFPPASPVILPHPVTKPVTPVDWPLGDRMYGTPTKGTGKFTSPIRTFTSFRLKPLPQRSGFFRYHVSGDIPDMDYLRMMVEIARELPFTNFMPSQNSTNWLMNGLLSTDPCPRTCKSSSPFGVASTVPIPTICRRLTLPIGMASTRPDRTLSTAIKTAPNAA